MIYRLSAEEGMSCIAIAKRLTALGLPTMYDAMFKSRKVPDKPTSGVWWYSRIQTVIRRTTYKGTHVYGRRGKKGRELIERQVPAIVDEETWEKAQGTMHRNGIYSGRGTKRRYLLRGLIRCKHCGLRYLGCADYRGQSHHWYCCSGSTGLLSGVGIEKHRCPGRALPQSIEDLVWGNIESFLREPGPILEQLREEMGSIEDQETLIHREIGLAEKRLDVRTTERERILTAFRRGTIDDAMLDQQMAAINDEYRQAEEALQDLEKQLHGLQDAGMSLDSTERLLRDLNDRLDAIGDDAPSFEGDVLEFL
jgi:site-specific DNA recombinase